jgi:chemotaxis methyl-accepting protein methylase
MDLTPAVRYRHVTFPRKPADYPGVKRGGNSAPLEGDESAFIRFVLAAGGLNMADYRNEPLQRRLSSCLCFLRADSLATARARLVAEPRLIPGAINALLLGVTSFFRDECVFTAIAERVIPELSRRRRPVNIWSLGCSDGSELYSVVMLFAAAEQLADTYFLGTDCRPQAVVDAREGIYSDSQIAAIPEAFRARFLERRGSQWQIVPEIRSKTHWWPQNAVARWDGAGTWDVVLCRNMAMYLETAATEKLWTSLERCLRPGGFLIVGKAERPTTNRRLAQVAPSILQRVN